MEKIDLKLVSEDGILKVYIDGEQQGNVVEVATETADGSKSPTVVWVTKIYLVNSFTFENANDLPDFICTETHRMGGSELKRIYPDGYAFAQCNIAATPAMPPLTGNTVKRESV